jgi:glucose/arabinose dehydrogenase
LSLYKKLNRNFLFFFICILLISSKYTAKSDLNHESKLQKSDSKKTYTVSFTKMFDDYEFNQPVDIQSLKLSFNYYFFIVERLGLIFVIDEDNKMSIFLDIRNLVDSSGFEMGLLGLAFHPNFDENGKFYVDYTAGNPRRTVISEFQVTDSNQSVDISTERVILEVPQPFSNHNAGQIAFGSDNYLYITMGDGGSGGDPMNHGQNKSTILGSILRIDIDSTETELQYSIPFDNPFVDDEEVRDEIYAYGLRNPWRMSFDSETGVLFAADVGQNRIEEINVIESGGNYGWRIMEGSLCHNPSDCDPAGLILPVYEYNHSQGNSITGGYVNRNGGDLLYGKYIFGDFGSGRIWIMETENDDYLTQVLVDTNFNIATFGKGSDGEIYFSDFFGGGIYKIVTESVTVETFTSDTSTSDTSMKNITNGKINNTSANQINTANSLFLYIFYPVFIILILVVRTKLSRNQI